MPSQTSQRAPRTSGKAEPSKRTNSGAQSNDHGNEDLGSHGHHHDDPRPLKSYAGIMASYGVLVTMLAALLRGKRFRLRPLSPWSFLLYALSAEHLSRLISKDSVTSPFRTPFTQFEGPAGEGEVKEEVIGHGPRYAIGELLTCPFCLDQWVATGLIAGSVAAPTLTTAVVSVSAVARAADYLQMVYGFLRERVD
jgi:hypothetical protein